MSLLKDGFQYKGKIMTLIHHKIYMFTIYLIMMELGRCYNQFKEFKEQRIIDEKY